MSARSRNNVRLAGSGRRAIVFAHGFGCDQNMWRLVAPAFEAEFQTVLFDHVGAGGSDLSGYAFSKYASLSSYAIDVVELIRELELTDVVFVGHSVSAMIGILAARMAPELFESLILVGPSPRYIDDHDYVGGFNAGQIEELLEYLEENHMGWSSTMAPVIMGNPDRPELTAELAASFCRTDPAIARDFARVTFTSDNRQDLAEIRTRCLILQCREDTIAPLEVGAYVHRAIAGSRLIILDATGHCPNLSAPQEVIGAIRAFL